MSVVGSTVSNNSGISSGGIFNELGTLSLTNSTVSNNTGGAIGGIANYNPQNIGSLTFTNSTVSDNLATGPNGVGGIQNFEGRANVANSNIAGNTAAFGTPDAAGVLLSQGYNLVGDGGVSTGFSAPGDQVGTTPAPLDPMLGPLQDNGGPTFTHALLPGSPAIDAGDPAYAGPLTTDQRGSGFARVFNNRIDIGAFELQPPPPCPLPQGDWKNNSVWPVNGLTLGDETYTNGELLDILNTPVGRGRNADASIILAYQLIAAKVNIANGVDGTSILSTIAETDALLDGLSGRLPYGVSPSSPTGKLMTGFATILDAFNNGTTTTGCSL
ncbi:MAG TPA: choice-of-anchor Q domain-containing protein, partial [Pyrinomonadaceae bacterium]|nr:choice-of-anchor Q domain-containing protein [Pyrinomonadaceae bacterium]